MSLGTLTVAPLNLPSPNNDAGGVVNFDNIIFDDGFPHEDPSWVVEPITAMGVDYSRIRLVRREFIPYRMTTVSGFPTYGDAVTAARAWRQFVGHLAQLTYNAGGNQYVLGNSYILSLVAMPMSGPLVGAALTYPGALAFVQAQFNLQFVQQ